MADFGGDFWRILLLQGGHNTTVVMVGAAALGVAAGAVGVFAMLRRRALVSDAVAHATLPGVAGAFILAAAFGLPGRSPLILMAGAAVTAFASLLAVQFLARQSRVTEDTATAAVLASTFGLGVALLSIVQSLSTGGQAGLDAYLFGATAGMLEREAYVMGALAVAVLIVIALLFKELSAAAFDPSFAVASGLPLARLDAVVALLSLVTVVVGLRVVGLVLIVALLIIPPAAARFWSDRIGVVVLASSLIGAAGAYLGAAVSAVAPDVPTGATIVIVCAVFFAVSLAIGPARGLLVRAAGSRRPAAEAGQ
jgi:manganese/zinc/iron transport system permease protein